MMKRFLRTLAHKTVLRPPSVRHCSQTVYEFLLGCMRMWEATGEALWRERAARVLEVLLGIQRPDGGFDIGYDFNFGHLHRKGESTSPELVALVALSEYCRLFEEPRAAEAAGRAAEWIRRHALDMGDGKMASPYGPYSVRAVMVYNGTSFAAGALGCYLGSVEDDSSLRTLYEGMVAYLDSVMSSADDLPGRFWYYADQSRDGLTAYQRQQVDYYHQCQQVEVHALAQQVSPLDGQLSVIRDAADHVVAVQDREGVPLPYMNLDTSATASVQVWGLCSAIPGLLEAAVVNEDRRGAYEAAARAVLDWLIEHSWTSETFHETLTRRGDLPPAVQRRYMVRSDAWVFNALASARKHLGDSRCEGIADRCYTRAASVDFSGPESHASSFSKRMVTRVFRVLGGLRGS